MSDEVESVKLKSGKVLKIYVDEDAEDPRKGFSNLGKMVCFHSRYRLGDKHEFRKEDYGSWEELGAAIIKQEKPAVILSLFLYDHSGLRMKVGSFMGLLPGGHAEFDSGQVGFIYASHADVLKEHGKKMVSKKLKALVEQVLNNEVEIYDNYLSGSVYGYRIVSPTKCAECGAEDEEETDSCWGYFGYDWRTNGIGEAVKDAGEEEDTGEPASTDVKAGPSEEAD